MLVAAVLGAILGVDIGIRAFDEQPRSNELLAWSAVLIVGAVFTFILGLRILRIAKQRG